MKQNWTVSDVENIWTLSSIELDFIKERKGANRLVLAVMLKFFQFSCRFPVPSDNIPAAIVNFVAKQLKSSATLLKIADFEGRSAFRNRKEIRDFLGIRKPTSADADNLKDLLVSETLPWGNWSNGFLTEKCYEHFSLHRLEPFSPGRISSIIGGAIEKYERGLFRKIAATLSPGTRARLDRLIEATPAASDPEHARLNDIRAENNAVGLDSILGEIAKLESLRAIGLPADVLSGVSSKILRRYSSRVSAEPPNELRAHAETTRHAMLAMFCHVRARKLTDNLIELLIRLVHKFENKAENKVSSHLLNELKHVKDKRTLLYQLSRAAVACPEGKVRDVIFPVIGEDVLNEIIEEYRKTGGFRDMVRQRIRASYMGHYRRVLSPILGILDFHPSNPEFKPVVDAVGVIRGHLDSSLPHYPDTEEIPVEGVASDASWRDFLFGGGTEEDGEPPRIRRINYEMTVLHALCEHLKCKGIWVEGSDEYRDPDEDLPRDFEERRERYYQLVGQPLDAEEFVADLRDAMRRELETLNEGMPENRHVSILDKKRGHIKVTPLSRQNEPPNTARLKQSVFSRWASTTLLDVLKEADFRLDICSSFETTATRRHLDQQSLARRLLLCLYGYGTNTGLKRVSSGNPGVDYQDLRYVRRRFISPVNVRDAIIRVTDAIFETRLEEIWGEATTACAGDSIKFGSWDQNLMTEWHVRYRGPGVMIYWHVDAKSACVHSQLKRCSSSEVASMIKGIISHCTKMDARKGYSDTHGQSLIGFAFSKLLTYELLPRLKGICRQKLHLPDRNCRYDNLRSVLRGTIDWDLITEQYDPMVKFAAAMKVGTADPEAILRRFTKNGDNHPVYRALQELGKAVKTIFLCRYLHSEELRREIHEALNVVENWNGANAFIFYGRHGEMSANRRDEQELSMLCLHLLQNCLVYINTIMIQTVLAGPEWKNRLTDEDKRALCPLMFEHINPYGLFPLDLDTRLDLEGDAA